MSAKNSAYRLGILFTAILFGFQLSIFGQTDESYKILTVPDTITNTEFYPFGGCLIYGKKPAAFSDFYSFSLEDTKQKSSAQKLEIVGAVMTSENGKNSVFRMEEVSLTNKTLQVKTETIDQIRYEFSGKYTKKGDLRRFYKNQTAVLQGKFAKIINGESASSMNVVFYFKVWKAESYYRPSQ